MKPNETFQLSEAWWKKSKPLLMPKTGLGDALKKFDTAEAKFLSSKTLKNYVAVKRAIDALETARNVAVAKCGGNPLLKDTKLALMKAVKITQRSELLKQAMAKAIEPELMRIERKVSEQTEASDELLQGLKNCVRKIEAARSKNDAAELKKQGKAVGYIFETARNRKSDLGNLSGDMTELNRELDECDGDFKAQAGRLKAGVLQYRKNMQTLKEVIDEHRTYEDLATDD